MYKKDLMCGQWACMSGRNYLAAGAGSINIPETMRMIAVEWLLLQLLIPNGC